MHIGITALKILENGEFIIGAGNGKVTQAKLVVICRMGSNLEMLQENGPQMCKKKLLLLFTCFYLKNYFYNNHLKIGTRGQVTSILVNCEDVLVGSTMNEIYYGRIGALDGTKMLL